MNRSPLFAILLFLLLTGAACGGGADNSGADTSTVPSQAQLDEAAAEQAQTQEAQAQETGAADAGASATDEAAAAPTAVPVVQEFIDPVVYADDFATSIAPIFAEKCADCHNVGGPGEIHWRLDTAGDLVATHEWISQVVQDRYMPPWPASDLSVAFHDNRSLRDDEIQAIVDWSAGGAPLDVEAGTAIIAPQGVIALEADQELRPAEPFQGNPDISDQYRCLVYEPELTETRWLTGFEFVPDQASIVHHAIGYMAPAEARSQATRLSEIDDLPGWQCYGGSGLGGDELFLGWAPGQLPTMYPEGAGRPAEPGDFLVMQIHYHYDTAEAPADSSAIKLVWSDEPGLDLISSDQFIGPAEIPCSSDETGPLCDRDAALQRAYVLYGTGGVLADGINRVCGVTPADFADMTDGIASSSCQIPMRDFGQIVSVFGHQHEIGKSIRLTLNAGQADEVVLLDIPDWDFDWQLSYELVEPITTSPGDRILLECTWDRSRRDPDLEPAYVLWADGTNDEMCFATIETLSPGSAASDSETSVPTLPDPSQVQISLPPELADCMAAAGLPFDSIPARAEVDATVDQLFVCAEPIAVGKAMSGLISANFLGLVGEPEVECMAAGLTEPTRVRELLVYSLEDSTLEERSPTAQLISGCVSLFNAITAFGIPLPETSRECVDEAGEAFLLEVALTGEIPEEQQLFQAINPCLLGS